MLAPDIDNGRGRILYPHKEALPNPTHTYLYPVLRRIVIEGAFYERRAIDLGCGNGSTAEVIRQLGFEVVGLDPSEQGIAVAKAAFPDIRFVVGNVYEDLAAIYGTFPLVVSFEVIEHLYDPRSLVRTVFNLLDDEGVALISTPYHGYWKNLALALAGRWERHHNSLRLHGHIKFFSAKQLRQLCLEEGFLDVSILRVGRTLPFLAKSMVAVVRKRASPR